MLQFQPVSCASDRLGWFIEIDPGFMSGSSHYCNESEAVVTFTFNGTGVYFLSPRWPYPMGMNVSVDGQPSQYINLTDPNTPTNFESNMTVASRPVWSAIDLRDTQHTLVLNHPTSRNGTFDFHIDGFIYVVEIPPTTPLTTPPLPTLAHAPSSTTSAPAPTSTSGPGSHFSRDGSGRKKYKVLCAISAIFTIAFIALVIWGTYECIRKKKAAAAAAAAQRQQDIPLGRTSSTPSLARDMKMGSEQSCETAVREPSISTISPPPSSSATLSSNRGPSKPSGPVPSTPASPDTTLELSVLSQQPGETSPMITDRTTGHG